MHKRLETYLLGKRFAGMEIEFRGETIVYHIAILKRSGNSVSVEQVFTEIQEEQLPLPLLKSLPLAVLFTGKGMLYRLLQADQDAKPETLIRKILPNAQSSDFYLHARNAGAEQFVSLTRRSQIDPMLTKWKAMAGVISAEIGVSCVALLQRQLRTQSDLQCGRHNVHFQHDYISSVKYLPDSSEETVSEPVHIGAEEIPGAALPAYAAALSAMLGQHHSLEASLQSTFLQKQLFRTTIRSALVLVLCALIANYFAFSHYWNLQQELQSQVGTQGTALAELNRLNEQIETRTAFLQRAGLLNTTSFAWYADQLGHSLPDGIRLSKMNFAPRIKYAEEDTIGFQPDIIELSGNCAQSVTLNRWIQFLQSESWVAGASIRSYEQNKSEANGTFTLDLQLH